MPIASKEGHSPIEALRVIMQTEATIYGRSYLILTKSESIHGVVEGLPYAVEMKRATTFEKANAVIHVYPSA